MKRTLNTSATSVTGTPIQKIPASQTVLATSPPSGGPHDPPSWTIIDCIPSARPRWALGKAWVRIAAELAQSAAEPSAVIARAPIRSPGGAAPGR